MRPPVVAGVLAVLLFAGRADAAVRGSVLWVLSATPCPSLATSVFQMDADVVPDGQCGDEYPFATFATAACSVLEGGIGSRKNFCLRGDTLPVVDGLVGWIAGGSVPAAVLDSQFGAHYNVVPGWSCGDQSPPPNPSSVTNSRISIIATSKRLFERQETQWCPIPPMTFRCGRYLAGRAILATCLVPLLDSVLRQPSALKKTTTKRRTSTKRRATTKKRTSSKRRTTAKKRITTKRG